MNPNKCSKKKQKSRKLKSQVNTRNESGYGGGETICKTPPSPVDLMTSRELQYDHGARISVVRRLLKDTVRIDNFKEAILHNKHLFKNKYVLNVGCGIGICALFAAKAGAAKVFAVDNSNVVYYTKQIVEANNYSQVIEVIKGKINEVKLSVSEVDVIVSDWMGYALLYESSCHDVIFARDKWLKKPGGLIFPDEAKLFMVAFQDSLIKNRNIEWWRRVYGFNMNCLREVALKEPRVHSINPQQVLSKQFPIKTFNLNTATLEDLKVRNKFILPITKSGHVDGIALYFHVYFTKSHIPFGFSTDPWSLATDWLQTKLFLDDYLVVKHGSIYYGGIEFHPAKKPCNFRDMIINLEILKGDPTETEEEVQMSWHFKLYSDGIDDDVKNQIKSNKRGKKALSENKLLNKPIIIKNSIKTDNNRNILIESSTTNLSLLKTDFDIKNNCQAKTKIIDSCKTTQSIMIKNSESNNMHRQLFIQNPANDLGIFKVTKNDSDSCNTTKRKSKQNNNHKGILIKDSKTIKYNYQTHKHTFTQSSAIDPSNDSLDTIVTIGKTRHNKSKLPRDF